MTASEPSRSDLPEGAGNPRFAGGYGFSGPSIFSGRTT